MVKGVLMVMVKRCINYIYKALSSVAFALVGIGFTNKLITLFLSDLNQITILPVRILVCLALIVFTIRYYRPYDFPWKLFRH